MRKRRTVSWTRGSSYTALAELKCQSSRILVWSTRTRCPDDRVGVDPGKRKGKGLGESLLAQAVPNQKRRTLRKALGGATLGGDALDQLRTNSSKSATTSRKAARIAIIPPAKNTFRRPRMKPTAFGFWSRMTSSINPIRRTLITVKAIAPTKSTTKNHHSPRKSTIRSSVRRTLPGVNTMVSLA